MGVYFLILAGIDTLLIHYSTWAYRDTHWPWIFSLLLPILVFIGCILIGKGLGEKKDVVYDYRHTRAPDSDRNVR